MMSKMHGAKCVVAALIAAWALVSCGGGDNGNHASSPGGSPSTGFSGQDATAPTLTNNPATDGFNWINYRRAQIGMPALTRSSRIDIAAQGHSDYQRVNNTVSHSQTPGKPGFTGASLQDRMEATGYVFGSPNAIGEVISATTNRSGFYMAEELITAVYHRFVIFEPVFREAGSGSATTSGGYTYFTTDFATNNGYGPGIAGGAIATWPFNGQTQVPLNFLSNSEEPDPVPDLNEVGYPISVHVNLTHTLVVSSFTVHARGASGILPTRLLAKGLDPNTTTSSAAAIVPLAPLAAATTYDVSFSGMVDGTPVNRTWSFTTR